MDQKRKEQLSILWSQYEPIMAKLIEAQYKLIDKFSIENNLSDDEYNEWIKFWNDSK